MQRLSIQHPLEINSGTLGKYRKKLYLSENKGKISSTERLQLSDAITVLADVRRNIDVHVFLKTQVGGSMQNDLTHLYIPAVNILISAY